MEGSRRRISRGGGSSRFDHRSSSDDDDEHSIEAASFRYNCRLAIIMLPCLMLLLIAGGGPLFAVVVVGTVFAYIFDAMDVPEAAFIILWLTISAMVVCLCIVSTVTHESAILKTFMLLNYTSFMISTGFWITIQTPFVQLEFDDMMATFERLLFASLCMPSTTILMIAVVSFFGMSQAPLYLCGVMMLTITITMAPLPTSFPGADTPKGQIIMGQSVTAMHMGLYYIFPSIMHLALHHRSLHTVTGLADFLLVTCLPAILLHTALPPAALWWTGFSETEIKHSRPFVLMGAAVVLTAAVEYRVVIHAFSSYLYYHSSLRALSTLLVTLCMYCGAAAAMLAYYGFRVQDSSMATREAQKARFVAFQCCLHTSALTGCLAIGMPLYVLPLVPVGAQAAIIFYTHRSFPLYAAFVAAVTIVMAWFMNKSYWFLQAPFGASISLRAACAGVVVLAAMVLLAPGLLSLPPSGWAGRQHALGLLLGAYALGLAAAEALLASINQNYATAVYPAYMVVLTSCAGAAIVHGLHREGRLLAPYHWLLLSAFVSKLGLLWTDRPRALLDCLAICLAVTAPFLLHRRPAATVAARAAATAPHAHMGTRVAAAHAASIVGSILAARHSVLAPLLGPLCTRAPSPALVLAAAMVAAAMALGPLAFHTLHHRPAFRRAHTVAVGIALVFLLLQPDLGLLVGEDHHGAEPRWPSWLLFLGLALSGLSLLVPLPWAMLAVSCGSCLGLFICGTYLPLSLPLYVLVVVLFDLTALCLVFLMRPGSNGPSLLRAIYGLLVAVLPVALFTTTQIFSFSATTSADGQARMAEVTFRVTLLTAGAALHFAIALCAKLSLERMEARGRSRRGALAAGVSASSPLQWAAHAFVGNLATVLALGLGLTAHMLYLDGSEASILLVAPVLLLLNPGNRGPLACLASESRRYLPPVVFSVAFLALHGLHATWGLPSAWPLWAMVKSVACLGCSAGSVWALLVFLWRSARQDGFALGLLAPLNLLTMVFADVGSIRLLGGVGLAGAVFVLISCYQLRQRGMSVL